MFRATPALSASACWVQPRCRRRRLRVSPHRAGTRSDTRPVAACQPGFRGFEREAVRDTAGSRRRAPPQAIEPGADRGRSGVIEVRRAALSSVRVEQRNVDARASERCRTVFISRTVAPASAALSGLDRSARCRFVVVSCRFLWAHSAIADSSGTRREAEISSRVSPLSGCDLDHTLPAIPLPRRPRERRNTSRDAINRTKPQQNRNATRPARDPPLQARGTFGEIRQRSRTLRRHRPQRQPVWHSFRSSLSATRSMLPRARAEGDSG